MSSSSNALPNAARPWDALRKFAMILGAIVACGMPTSSRAQFTRVINVPTDEPTWFVTSGTQLNLFEGGVIPHELHIEDGAELNVYGGYASSRMSIAGSLSVLGGQAGSLIEAYDAEVTIDGGYVGTLEANGNTNVVISGGQVLSYRQAVAGSGTITGGSVANVLGTVTMVGGEFAINGVPFAGTKPQLLQGDRFTGTFSDGTPFILDGDWRNHYTLVESPLAAIAPEVQVVDQLFDRGGLRRGESAELIEGGELPVLFRMVGAKLEVHGGSIGAQASVVDSDLVVKSGSVGAALSVLSGSHLQVEGGVVAGIGVGKGGQVDIHGGRLGRGVYTSSSDGRFTLHGGEFQINGHAVTSGRYMLATGSRLTGTLADGSPFVVNMKFPYGPEPFELSDAPIPAVKTDWQFVNPAQSPNGLRVGEKLVVQTGGAVPENFTAIGAELRVEGGTVGKYLNALNSSIEVVGGSIGDETILYAGSQLRVVGGQVGTRLSAEKDTRILLDGGRIDERMTTEGDVTMSGGYLGRLARIGGKFELRGGVVASGFDLGLSSWDVYGGEFRLNGEPIAAPTVSLGNLDVLTGTLEDGSPFVFTRNDGRYGQPINLYESSLPPIHSAPYVVTQPWLLNGLRAGETAMVKAGGVLSESLAVVGGRLLVEGGEVGSRLEVYDGQVSIRGGKVGQHLRLMGNSQGALEQGEIDGVSLVGNSSLSVTGGRVSRYLDTASSGVLTVTAGDIDASVRVGLANAPRNTIATTEVNIEGGTFRQNVIAYNGSRLSISGGEFLTVFDAYEGSRIVISGGTQSPHFRAFPGSEVTIVGTEFFIDGERFTGLVSGVEHLLSLRDVELSGTLANGDSFRFMLHAKEQYNGYFNPKSQLRLLLVPEPTNLIACVGFLLLVVSMRGPRMANRTPTCRMEP